MNAISISNVAIRQTENNLYNLNDLHKAAGSEHRHRPNNWLQNAQTKDLIAEIEAEGGKACEVINGGKNRGTFVCKELVYAYATWISAKFFLLVIRTFDAVISDGLFAEGFDFRFAGFKSGMIKTTFVDNRYILVSA